MRHFIEVVSSVHLSGQSKLLLIIHTFGSLCLVLCGRKRRQEQTGENRDNRNDHQQLDQGESTNSRLTKPKEQLCFHRA
jgi:hypothetical protein